MILDIERLGSGKVTLPGNASMSGSFLDNTVELFRAMADRAGVLARSGPLRGAIWADHDRIPDTTNLLSNAIKFSHADRRSRSQANRLDRLQFEVRDEGRGFRLRSSTQSSVASSRLILGFTGEGRDRCWVAIFADRAATRWRDLGGKYAWQGQHVLLHGPLAERWPNRSSRCEGISRRAEDPDC